MMKTGHDIRDEIYGMLKGSALEQAVSGEVYKNGYRPRDSRLEDIVVTFTQSTAAQVQDGIVTVNIYVPDIDPYNNGVWVENGARTEKLESALLTWFEGIDRSATDLRLEAAQPPYTMEDSAARQHFVTLRIRFRYLDTQSPEPPTPPTPPPGPEYDIFCPQIILQFYAKRGGKCPAYYAGDYVATLAVPTLIVQAKYIPWVGNVWPTYVVESVKETITEKRIANWKNLLSYVEPMTEETEEWLRNRIGRVLVTYTLRNIGAGKESVLATYSATNYESKPVTVYE